MNTYLCEHTPEEYCHYCHYLYLNRAPDPAPLITPHLSFGQYALSQTFQPISYPPPDYPPLGHSPVTQPLPTRLARRNPRDVLHACYPEDSEESNRLRALLATCLGSPWYIQGQPEPQGALDHFIREHPPNNFVCSVHLCQAFRDRLDKMRDHVRLHIDHRPYPCSGCYKPDCTARFCTKEARSAHEEIGNKRTVCPICGQVTAKKNLKRHLDTQRCRGVGGMSDSGPQ